MTEKVKEKEQPRVSENIVDKPPIKKTEPSPFDKVLEKSILDQKSSLKSDPILAKPEQYDTSRVVRREDGEKKQDEKSDERDRQSKKEKAKSDRTDHASVDYKIVGKGKTKGGGADTGGGRSYGHALTERRSQVGLSKAAQAKIAAAAMSSKFSTEFNAALKAQVLSREHIQHIVNQIVKFVGTGVNLEGDKEVRLELNEKVFRGLRLRVSVKHDKVNIMFLSSDAEVRNIFSASAGDIKAELEAKGIAVGDIKVG